MCSSLLYYTLVYCTLKCTVQKKKFTGIITFTKFSVINKFSQTVQILVSHCMLLVRLLSSLKFPCCVRSNHHRDKSIQSTPPHSKFLRLILILSSFICRSLKTISSLPIFRQNSVCISPIRLHDPAISSAFILCP